MDQDRTRSRWRFLMGVLAKVVCVAGGIAVLGVAVMLLWNWVLPPIFPGVAEIGLGRALGLLVLCRILFGGFRGRHGHWHDRKRRMRDRWHNMTQEERERFKSRMRMFGRCHQRD